MPTSHNAKASLFGKIARMAAIALAACALAVCAGCASQIATEEEVGNTASQYMVSLNDASAELKAELTEFAEAAAGQRISTMQAKAEEAYATLDEMAALEAPEALSELKEKYADAAAQLKEALSGYIELYTEVLDTQLSSIDMSAYAEKLESIQRLYDSALNALEEADVMAAEK